MKVVLRFALFAAVVSVLFFSAGCRGPGLLFCNIRDGQKTKYFFEGAPQIPPYYREDIIDATPSHDTILTLQLAGAVSNHVPGILRERDRSGRVVGQWHFPFYTYPHGSDYAVSPNREKILRLGFAETNCATTGHRLFLISNIKDPKHSKEEELLPLIEIKSREILDWSPIIFWLDDRRAAFLSVELPEDGLGRLAVLDTQTKDIRRLPYVLPSMAQLEECGYCLAVSVKNKRLAMLVSPGKVVVLDIDDFTLLFEEDLPPEMLTYCAPTRLTIDSDGSVVLMRGNRFLHISANGRERRSEEISCITELTDYIGNGIFIGYKKNHSWGAEFFGWNYVKFVVDFDGKVRRDIKLPTFWSVYPVGDWGCVFTL